jgi:transposase-like protein
MVYAATYPPRDAYPHIQQALGPDRSGRDFYRPQGAEHAQGQARQKITGRGPKDKTVVMGVLERGGEVRVAVVPTRRKGDIQRHVKEHALAGSALFTDALKSFDGLDEFQHEVVDHAVEYVRGEVHTNGMENFWSLLKCGLHGTYVSVEPFRLFRYLDEQAFRVNKRHTTDANRSVQLCSNVVGKGSTGKL